MGITRLHLSFASSVVVGQAVELVNELAFEINRISSGTLPMNEFYKKFTAQIWYHGSWQNLSRDWLEYSEWGGYYGENPSGAVLYAAGIAEQGFIFNEGNYFRVRISYEGQSWQYADNNDDYYLNYTPQITTCIFPQYIPSTQNEIPVTIEANAGQNESNQSVNIKVYLCSYNGNYVGETSVVNGKILYDIPGANSSYYPGSYRVQAVDALGAASPEVNKQVYRLHEIQDKTLYVYPDFLDESKKYCTQFEWEYDYTYDYNDPEPNHFYCRIYYNKDNDFSNLNSLPYKQIQSSSSRNYIYDVRELVPLQSFYYKVFVYCSFDDIEYSKGILAEETFQVYPTKILKITNNDSFNDLGPNYDMFYTNMNYYFEDNAGFNLCKQVKYNIRGNITGNLNESTSGTANYDFLRVTEEGVTFILVKVFLPTNLVQNGIYDFEITLGDHSGYELTFRSKEFAPKRELKRVRELNFKKPYLNTSIYHPFLDTDSFKVTVLNNTLLSDISKIFSDFCITTIQASIKVSKHNFLKFVNIDKSNVSVQGDSLNFVIPKSNFSSALTANLATNVTGVFSIIITNSFLQSKIFSCYTSSTSQNLSIILIESCQNLDFSMYAYDPLKKKEFLVKDLNQFNNSNINIPVLKEKMELKCSGTAKSYNGIPKAQLKIHKIKSDTWITYDSVRAFRLDPADSGKTPSLLHPLTYILDKQLFRTIETIFSQEEAEFFLLVKNPYQSQPDEYSLSFNGQKKVLLFQHSLGKITSKIDLVGDLIKGNFIIQDYGFIENSKIYNNIKVFLEYKIPGTTSFSKNELQLKDFSLNKQIPFQLNIQDLLITEWNLLQVHLLFQIETAFPSQNSLYFNSTYNTPSNESSIYNIAPTVAYRKNKIGINNSIIQDNDVITISQFKNNNCITFKGVLNQQYREAKLYLDTGELDNFIIDGGSWT